MMKYLKHLTAVMIIMFCGVTAFADNTAERIMKNCAAKFGNAPSVTVDFAIAQNDGSATGTMVMAKRLFSLSTADISIWFDGKTQWTYMANGNEVNITEPTGEELMESNPFELISTFAQNFNCRLLKSPATADIIELTPKHKDMNISSAKITVSKSTGWPTAMIINFEGGNSTSVSVSKVTVGKTMSVAQFRFDQKTHKGVQVIDLR